MGGVSYDFCGEPVVVTGGSFGIGRAVALRFGEAGAAVVNADIRKKSKDVGEETPPRESSRARRRSRVRGDEVSDASAIAAAVDAAELPGGVDVMVNNAE